MSGLRLRRFILQNITAVAVHCPLPAISRSARVIAVGGNYPSSEAKNTNTNNINIFGKERRVERWIGGLFGAKKLIEDLGGKEKKENRFALVSSEEMEWIRRRRREEAEESRILFDTRPSNNLFRGIAGGALNLALGAGFSPIIFVAFTLEKLCTVGSLLGVLMAPIYGLAWAGVFLATAVYAGLQQVLLSAFYALVKTPFCYCVSCHRAYRTKDAAGAPFSTRAWLWSPLACRFEVPYGRRGIHHPLLANYDDDEVLHERGMRRLARRRKSSQPDFDYAANNPSNGEASSESYRGVRTDDYYGLLGVRQDASEREIKAAYNRLVLKIHPDHNPSPEATTHFNHLTQAYRVLSSAEKRKKYDLVGAKGVENPEEKKREAMRAIFGGETLQKLIGDVFLNSFAYRVVDGVDLTQEEIAVRRQRMYDRCRDELLRNYIENYRGVAGNCGKGDSNFSKISFSGLRGSSVSWGGEMQAQLRAISKTGLSKEVLYAVGNEYRRVVRYFDSQYAPHRVPSSTNEGKRALLPLIVFSRLRNYFTEEGPHRWRRKYTKLRHLVKLRGSTFKNSESMIDLSWHSGVGELERTAKVIAFSILFDPQVSVEEVLRRREALLALSELFISHGRPYKGADSSTINQLMNSLREYQQKQERKFD